MLEAPRLVPCSYRALGATFRLVFLVVSVFLLFDFPPLIGKESFYELFVFPSLSPYSGPHPSVGLIFFAYDPSFLPARNPDITDSSPPPNELSPFFLIIPKGR